MTQQEIQFLVENKINFESVKLGFTRNIPFDVLGQYEAIYRKYLDPQFVLTYWCGSCVFDMIERLITFCECDSNFVLAYTGATNPGSFEAEAVKPKRGRPKKQ